MWNISRAHRISSSMQSASVASRDSRFPIASTMGLQVLMSWLRHAQYSGSAMTVLIMSGGTGDRLLVFFCASGRTQIRPSGALCHAKSDTTTVLFVYKSRTYSFEYSELAESKHTNET